jgi:hypothetical protein
VVKTVFRGIAMTSGASRRIWPCAKHAGYDFPGRMTLCFLRHPEQVN